MAVIKKKVWPEFFKELLRGSKTFELRLNDFNVAEGDALILEEWDPATKSYTGRSIEKTVGYIARFKTGELPFWPSEEVASKGLQIISLK